MRVTQQMISQQFIQNLHRSNKSMETLHGQISSGNKYERISDQPGEVLKGLSYRSSLSQIEQYQKNVEDGISWSSAVDGELGNVTNVLHRVRELTLQASNDSNNPSDRKNIAVEVRSLIDQIGKIANTEYGSGFLFSGTDLNTQPYQNGALQQSNPIVKEWNVGQGLSVKGNVHAASVFGFSVDGKNLFETIEVVAQTLENGENPGSLLNSIDQQLDHVITQRTVVGINQNTLELASNKLEQSELLHKKMLSTVGDTDISKAFTELSAQETLLQASLSAGGKILQQSLADFLR
jgi:flagellar hook-associated protein 3 FlgL